MNFIQVNGRYINSNFIESWSVEPATYNSRDEIVYSHLIISLQ